MAEYKALMTRVFAHRQSQWNLRKNHLGEEDMTLLSYSILYQFVDVG